MTSGKSSFAYFSLKKSRALLRAQPEIRIQDLLQLTCVVKTGEQKKIKYGAEGGKHTLAITN